jgi:hypothetical protein
VRTINNVTGFLFGLAIAALLVCAMLPKAHAADPPAAPERKITVPRLVLGVEFCGQEILWVLNQDGKVRRFDKQHTPPPNEMAIFRAWIDAAEQSDVQVLPCPTGT